MTNYSPLRYPGGKGKLAPYMNEVLQMNHLEGGHYAEPFAGGAAIALELLFSERVKHIHINDLDWAVFCFWTSAIYETEAFVEKLMHTTVNVESWLIAREIKKYPTLHSVLDLGFATFFLNRTNRSGILNGGIIGGLSQQGEWKIDCRFNKEELVTRIRRLGIYRSRISVTNLDAVEFLENYMPQIEPTSLIYIDPPYYVKGAYLYQNHFNHGDHVALAEVVRGIQRHKWVVSYDNAEQIRSIYKGLEQEQFSIGYSARNYGKGAEVMVFGKDVKRPGKIFANKQEHRRLRA
jgi:DNA adenine methylase